MKRRAQLSLDQLEAGVLSSDRAVLGRAVTLLESQRADHRQQGGACPGRIARQAEKGRDLPGMAQQRGQYSPGADPPAGIQSREGQRRQGAPGGVAHRA